MTASIVIDGATAGKFNARQPVEVLESLRDYYAKRVFESRRQLENLENSTIAAKASLEANEESYAAYDGLIATLSPANGEDAALAAAGVDEMEAA